MTRAEMCFLFDNGSLRATATLTLRRLAAAIEARIDCPVRPVSLLHSSAVSPEETEGRPAELLEQALEGQLAAGMEKAVLLPLFFGPSGAIVDYLSRRIKAISRRYPTARIQLARCVVDPTEPDDVRVASALAERVREAVATMSGPSRAQVVLVDHGSPKPGVAAARNHLGRQLAAILADGVHGVHVASMERRPGPRFAFNDPLLIDRLTTPPCDSGEVVIALQFFSQGRHAGPDGDIAAICSEAMKRRPSLRTRMTEPIGVADPLVSVLVDRFNEARQWTTGAH